MMKRFMPNMQIRHKIWAGYGLLVIILAVVSLSAWFGLGSTQRAMDEIVSVKQPAMMQSMELARDLERAVAGMGFYLLSGEEAHRENFTFALTRVQELSAELAANPYVASQAELSAQVANIAANVERLGGFSEEIIRLAQDPAANIPAMAFAGQSVNPLSQQMLQQLGQMLLTEAEEPATPERKRLLTDINDLRYAWANVMNGVRAYLAFRGEASLNEVSLYMEQTGAVIERIQESSALLTFDQEDSLSQFIELREQFIASYEELKAIHGGEQGRMDAYLIRTEIGPLVAEIEYDLAMLGSSLQEEIKTVTGSLNTQLAATESTTLVLMLVGVGIGILAAWGMSRMIGGPLRQLSAAMTDIAEGEGDLTHRLQVTSRDEIGQLAQAFNTFAGKVHDVVNQVKGSVAQLAAAAEQMSVITSQTSEGVARQQLETDQVATAMHQMNATAQEVARNASNTASATEEADRETRSGQAVVNRTVEAMNALAGEVERAAGVIMKVEKDSESIGTVMQVIRDIAEQTNLLALNAAIEAARAGEQGRGFAVVADEVRTLASRTQASTEEIDQVIKTLQGATREAVQVMEASRDKARTGVDQASEAGKSLTSISGAVDNITEMGTQIASAAEEQSAVVEEISRNVTSISEVASQTAEGTRQLAAASNELANLSADLQALVGRFKVAD